MASVTETTYAYVGKDMRGKTKKGRIVSLSQSAAVMRLQGRGIAVESISEAPSGGLNTEIKIPGLGENHAGLKDIAVMARQMATMISSGLSLIRTLNILVGQTENEELAQTLAVVRADVETGQSLSDALAKHPVIFPLLMINLVRAGETGGFLDESLMAVADNFESEVKLRGKVKSAMTYPIVVLGIAVLAVIIMLVFIVPVFKEMFANNGGELPIPTQILVMLSEAMVYIIPVSIVLIIVFTMWWRKNKHTDKVRKVVDDYKLRLPIFGELFRKIAVARFCRNLSTMVKSGVPLLQSLHIVGETSGNYMLEQAVHRVVDSVRQGRSLSAPMMNEPIFPSMVSQMISVGEDSGSLESMLEKVADFYDDEVETATDSLTAMLEPLLVGFLGAVVGGMLISLYMPIFSLMDTVK